MAILASSIITSVRATLLDPTPGKTWTDARLLALINEAERAIENLKNEAYTVRGAVALVAGSHQTLPAGAVGLLDTYHNAVSGRRCTIVDAELMAAASRFYPAATQEVDAQHAMLDARDATRFTVVPPNNGTGSLICLYGAIPTAIASTASAINLNDRYESVIKAFVIAEAYAENTDRQDLVKAGAYETKWKQLLGIGSQSQVAAAGRPNRSV